MRLSQGGIEVGGGPGRLTLEQRGEVALVFEYQPLCDTPLAMIGKWDTDKDECGCRWALELTRDQSQALIKYLLAHEVRKMPGDLFLREVREILEGLV